MHALAEFALDEGLEQQGEDVDAEEGFDPAIVFEEDRRDREDALELREPFLDRGLAAVGGE
jgi:hypothetical protein